MPRPCCPTASSAVTHTSHTDHARTHTHCLPGLDDSAVFSSAGVSTRESSKAQLCRTGETLSSRRGCKNRVTFKGKWSCLNLPSCVQRFDLENLERSWKAAQQRVSLSHRHFTELRFHCYYFLLCLWDCLLRATFKLFLGYDRFVPQEEDEGWRFRYRMQRLSEGNSGKIGINPITYLTLSLVFMRSGSKIKVNVWFRLQLWCCIVSPCILSIPG